MAGVPEIVGATFEREVARIEKPASAFVLEPSLTLIEMFVHKPTELGVPLNLPVVVLKLAQVGLFEMENLRV